MKNRIYTGYAVVTSDILDDKKFKKGVFGITFKNADFEKCKRYCYRDGIIVRTYRRAFSYDILIRWIRKYPQFRISDKYASEKYIQIGHLKISCCTTYRDDYERVALYQEGGAE